jgi:hypothetical protein
LWNGLYLPFYIWNKIIWIVKKEWNKSFLAFEDVFDNDWTLIFVKGFIYNIDIDWEELETTDYINHDKIDLFQFSWEISRNPMRPINKFKEEKVNSYLDYNWKNDFDEIVQYFIKKNNL